MIFSSRFHWICKTIMLWGKRRKQKNWKWTNASSSQEIFRKYGCFCVCIQWPDNENFLFHCWQISIRAAEIWSYFEQIHSDHQNFNDHRPTSGKNWWYDRYAETVTSIQKLTFWEIKNWQEILLFLLKAELNQSLKRFCDYLRIFSHNNRYLGTNGLLSMNNEFFLGNTLPKKQTSLLKSSMNWYQFDHFFFTKCILQFYVCGQVH